MELGDLINLIGNIGVGGVVALIVVLRLEPGMAKLAEVVQHLTIIVARTSGQDYDQVVREFGVNGGRRRR